MPVHQWIIGMRFSNSRIETQFPPPSSQVCERRQLVQQARCEGACRNSAKRQRLLSRRHGTIACPTYTASLSAGLATEDSNGVTTTETACPFVVGLGPSTGRLVRKPEKYRRYSAANDAKKNIGHVLPWIIPKNQAEVYRQYFKLRRPKVYSS
ncbi:hypothetical protein T265_04802 [Opisthorchis viverrini]|uniref:Uncharacterized protein n=1 Tax=Opisthorchis viverrini TaxID=6198 RepID=A0A074ZR96_OPIVI|nr:hypothetical protein T265_04802 [Opisthorchis viverrini]KER28342.1 hypothetical protein T265_04802 [Opisthorchis viverrini]